MERWLNKVAVVTGASSGIGAALVKDLVKAGLQVVGLGRRIELIEALKGQVPEDKSHRLTALNCDVSSHDDVKQAFKTITSLHGGVDVLVNNAGCMQMGQLSTLNPETINSVLQTNVMGVVNCTHEAFRSMKERNFDGHIMIMNSISGHRVMPGGLGKMPISNMYSPSKHTLTCLTEIYRQEFRAMNTKIKITSISPGLTDTEMIDPRIKEKYSSTMLSAEDVTQAVLYALSTPPHVQIHELIIKPVGEIQ